MDLMGALFDQTNRKPANFIYAINWRIIPNEDFSQDATLPK